MTIYKHADSLTVEVGYNEINDVSLSALAEFLKQMREEHEKSLINKKGDFYESQRGNVHNYSAERKSEYRGQASAGETAD